MPPDDTPAGSVSQQPQPSSDAEGASAARGDAHDLICPSALTYLRDLHQAAMIAQQLRDQIAVQRTGLRLGRRSSATATKAGGLLGLGSLGPPIDVVLDRQFEHLSDALHDTSQTLGFIAAWYAESALICLRRVLGGQPVHVGDLEKDTARDLQRTLARWGGRDDAADHENGAPWGPRNRPDIPTLCALDTGDDALDFLVRDVHDDLLHAYEAASRAEGLHLRTDLAAGESFKLRRAEQLAERIPDLLISFSGVVSHAAECLAREVGGDRQADEGEEA